MNTHSIQHVAKALGAALILSTLSVAAAADVKSVEYNLGDQAYTPANFPAPVELRASVTFDDSTQGPRPLVMFLHGRHPTCFDAQGAVSLTWPCPAGSEPIESFRGYDYVARHLASRGMVVVSISANGINGNDQLVQSDKGATARGDLMQKHVALLREFAAGTGVLGSDLNGRIDFSRVGVMGHSRGGEGVVRFAQLNAGSAQAVGLKAVHALAPSNFNRLTAPDVSLAVTLPYCDGDVADLSGAYYFDDVRLAVPGRPVSRYRFVDLGANHNFYNTLWTPNIFAPGSSDDWSDLIASAKGTELEQKPDTQCDLEQSGRPGKRLTDQQQRLHFTAYMDAFFGAELLNDGLATRFLAGLNGQAIFNVLHNYAAPDTNSRRVVINDFADAAKLSANNVGGTVSIRGFASSGLCGSGVDGERFCTQQASATAKAEAPTLREPQARPFQPFLTPDQRGVSQLRLSWEQPGATLTQGLSGDARDIGRFQWLQIGLSASYDSPTPGARNPDGSPIDFLVLVEDGQGRQASIKASQTLVPDERQIRSVLPGDGAFLLLPKILHNAAWIPLQPLIAQGIDASNVRSISLVFDATPTGTLLLTDMSLTRF